jgi:hypothetical protein
VPDRVNLSDPDFEPTDEQLIGLSKRAFANVARDRAHALKLLRQQIAKQREIAIESFKAWVAAAESK